MRWSPVVRLWVFVTGLNLVLSVGLWIGWRMMESGPPLDAVSFGLFVGVVGWAIATFAAGLALTSYGWLWLSDRFDLPPWSVALGSAGLSWASVAVGQFAAVGFQARYVDWSLLVNWGMVAIVALHVTAVWWRTNLERRSSAAQ